jgi:hypothetical protein
MQQRNASSGTGRYRRQTAESAQNGTAAPPAVSEPIEISAQTAT